MWYIQTMEFSLSFFLFGCTTQHAALPQPGTEPTSPAVEAQSLNHGMAREVPRQWSIIVLQRKKILDKWEFIIYSWTLNDVSLNCVGPLTCGLFSIVITTVLCDLWLVDSEGTNMNMEKSSRQKADYADFQLGGGSVPLAPVWLKGQLYIFFTSALR